MRAASCFLGGFFFRKEEGPFLFPTYLSKALSSQGTFEHKTNNSALAVNALHSHGPGNEEASRKWGSPSERFSEAPGSDHSGRHLRRKSELQGSATVSLRKMNLRRR